MRFEDEVRNFRWAPVTHRQNDGTEAATHVDLRSAEPVASSLEAHMLIGAAVNTANQRQTDLTAMRVSGKNEVDAERRGVFNNCGIVGEQKRRHILRNTTHCPGKIGTVEKVVDARKAKLLASAAKHNVLIAEDFNAIVIERASDLISPDAKIMISENGENAVTSAQTGQHLRNGSYVIAGASDEVSREGNDVRIKFVRQLDGYAQSRCRKIKPVMDIGQLNNPKPAKRVGQIANADSMLGKLDMAAQGQSLELLDAARLAQRVGFDAAMAPATLQAVQRFCQSAASRLWKNVSVRHSVFSKFRSCRLTSGVAWSKARKAQTCARRITCTSVQGLQFRPHLL